MKMSARRCPAFSSQQHTSKVTAKGDTAGCDILPDNTGSAVAYLLQTEVDNWDPSAEGSEGVSAWLSPQIFDELPLNMPHLENLDKLCHIFNLIISKEFQSKDLLTCTN